MKLVNRFGHFDECLCCCASEVLNIDQPCMVHPNSKRCPHYLDFDLLKPNVRHFVWKCLSDQEHNLAD